MKKKTHSFFATIARMKYIERWALMRNSRPENLSEHAAEVAMIAHALCVIGNARYGRHLDADRAALIDMPTPVKYYNRHIRDAYREVEAAAEDHLLQRLPEDLRPVYEEIFRQDTEDEDERYMRRLVKAADKLSALIKCMEEENSGNREFRTAKESTLRSIEKMAEDLPELTDFLTEFLPPYGRTLDELG